MALQPGQTIGRYQIIEPLGTGGMATVYKAYQPSLEREVALKVLRPGFADDPEFLQRFQREARSIAKLRHPHIVQVFDFEPLDGRYVLAMEYLEGGTLKERIGSLAARGERLPPAEVARIVGEVADALNHGHELGIVHRDMKPSNVMLARRDRAVVTDFGIAKIVGGEGQTQTGVGIGTPEYMAPEQGAGGTVDQRADIYSLGVMAYELLTGRVPFVADTPLAVVLAHVRDPLPLPSSIDPTVSADTERVLMKTLAKNPGDRYATATEFADALKATLVTATATSATIYPIAAVTAGSRSAAAGAVPASAGGPRTRIPRNAIVAAAVVALLLVGGAAFAFTRAGTSAPTVSASAAPSKGTIALRGALIYEAKLDATGSEIQRQPGPPGRTADPNAIRTLDGAVQFTLPENQSFGPGSGPTPLLIAWRRSFPATFFAEMDVKVAPGSQFEVVWRVRQLAQASVQLAARAGFDESMELRYQTQPALGVPQGQSCPPNCPPPGGQGCPPNCAAPTPAPGGQGAPPPGQPGQPGQPGPGQFVQPETIGTPVGVSGFASGDKVTIGIAVQPQGVFTMFFNGRNVGQVTEARAAASGGPAGGGQQGGGNPLSIDVHGQNGTLTLTGFRVYQLATP